MKATEAKKITEQNQLSLTAALNIIEEQAKAGRNMAMFDNLHDDTFNRIVELGYRVSKFTDPLGVMFIRVEW